MFFWQSGQPHRRMNSLKPKRPCTVKSICMEWVQSRAVANWTVHFLCETWETHGQQFSIIQCFWRLRAGLVISCYPIWQIYIYRTIYLYIIHIIYIYIHIIIHIIIYIYIWYIYDMYTYIVIYNIDISHDLSLVWCQWQNIHHDPPAIHFRSQNVTWGQRLGNVNKHQIQYIYIYMYDTIQWYWILQFILDFKSIPVLWFHEIYGSPLLLSAPALFFGWSVTINVIWFDYISIALLVTGASTKWIQQPKANFHRYAIRFSVRTCRYTLSKLHILHTYIPLSILTPPTVPTGKSNKRWFAWLQCLMIFDSIYVIWDTPNVPPCICLHTWSFVPSLGRWEDP